jgi:hypothetical protein
VTNENEKTELREHWQSIGHAKPRADATAGA